MHACKEIVAMVQAQSLQLADALDSSPYRATYVGTMRERIVQATIVLRCIRYLPIRSRASRGDAYPHGDRSLWSHHLGSTHRGLWLIMPDGSRVRADELNRKIVTIFLGRKFAAAARNESLCCPHGVKTERVRDGEDRYAFVAFVHSPAIEGDVAWLKAHDAAMKATEQSLTI